MPVSVLPSQREKATAVKGMFSSIAPRYDLLNHLLSLNIDKRWRRRAVDVLLSDGPAVGCYLDACAGTMDLSVEIAARLHASADVVATDFAYPMLAAGLHKVVDKRIEVACADALQLPFTNGHFTGAIVGFGVRNLAAIGDGLRELSRVLAPGGKLVILEFTTPRWQPFRAIYLAYFKHVLPSIGKRISRHGSAYSYLPASVLEFPDPPALAAVMRSVGLRDVTWETRTGGIVAIHSGVKS